jgi:hypothetical protein
MSTKLTNELKRSTMSSPPSAANSRWIASSSSISDSSSPDEKPATGPSSGSEDDEDAIGSDADSAVAAEPASKKRRKLSASRASSPSESEYEIYPAASDGRNEDEVIGLPGAAAAGGENSPRRHLPLHPAKRPKQQQLPPLPRANRSLRVTVFIGAVRKLTLVVHAVLAGSCACPSCPCAPRPLHPAKRPKQQQLPPLPRANRSLRLRSCRRSPRSS